MFFYTIIVYQEYPMNALMLLIEAKWNVRKLHPLPETTIYMLVLTTSPTRGTSVVANEGLATGLKRRPFHTGTAGIYWPSTDSNVGGVKDRVLLCPTRMPSVETIYTGINT